MQGRRAILTMMACAAAPLASLALGSCGSRDRALLPTSPAATPAGSPAAEKGMLRALAFGKLKLDAGTDDQGGIALDITPGVPVPCKIFPADNIWNRDISNLPVHVKSGTWVTAIGMSKNLYVGFAPQAFGMQYALTGAATPKVSIPFSQDPTHCDPGPYPFTAGTPIEVGTPDEHAFMIDTTTCTLYELFGASWNGGHPQAAAGVVFPLASDALHTDGWSSADEAGLPIFPGLARWDEVLSGVIAHALRFEAATGHIDGTLGAHLWPARHDPHSSSVSDPSLPPMGARFRLKSSYDISGFSPHAQVILRALQHYGMFLADIGYDWELIGTADPRWPQSVIDELERVPASEFEAVDESSLMIAPNSAQSLPPPRSVPTGRLLPP